MTRGRRHDASVHRGAQKLQLMRHFQRDRADSAVAPIFDLKRDAEAPSGMLRLAAISAVGSCSTPSGIKSALKSRANDRRFITIFILVESVSKAAVPAPKLVIAIGACAISGGLYAGHPEQHDGAANTVPVDLYIPRPRRRIVSGKMFSNRSAMLSGCSPSRRCAPYFLRHRELLGDLCRAAWQTVREMMVAGAGEEIRPGMVAVIQTFGSTINFHPHVHAIVSRGGCTERGRWIPVPWVDAKAASGKRVLRQQMLLRPPTAEEFEMLAALHSEQESTGFARASPRELTTSSWERVYPEQENVPSKIFGGHLIHRAYQLASIHAEELASHRPVVVAVNRIDFLRPVRIGDKLHFASRIVYTGCTSIAVEIRIERVGRSRNVRDLTNDCVFTFVNVDAELCPQTVPAVYPTTYDEDARYLAAHRPGRDHLEWKSSRMEAAPR